VPAAPLADGATVTFTVAEMDTVIAPANPAADPPVWSGADDVRMHFMAFGATTTDPSIAHGQWLPRVPGPFLKVVANRALNVVLDNSSSMDAHSIDFHALVGDKGGAAMLMANPGERASFTIRPTHPGLFVYHCAESGTPRGIAEHMNTGMYGLILVLAGDAAGAIDAADGFNQALAVHPSEHYVFEGDVYRSSDGGFDETRELDTLAPDYVVYNGRVSALVDHPLVGSASSNGYVIYHAAAGSHVASFHVIGAVFDRTWEAGDTTSPPLRNLQTVLVASSGSTVVEVDKVNLVVNAGPGGNDVKLGQLNVLVDHASAYFRKGALGFMIVTP
jgi:nitrite reductase (NO-forming)